MNETRLDLGALQYEIHNPKRLAPMPHWPGAKHVIKLAVGGWPAFALGLRCPDKSYMAFEYVVQQREDIPDDVWDKLGSPLLSVIVRDNGRGISMVHGIPTRVLPNDAEKYLQELQEYIGKDKELAVIAQGLSMTNTVRQYFWKVEA